MTSFDELKDAATLPTGVVFLCLAGELQEQLDQLERQLVDAPPATSIGEGSPGRAIAEQIVTVRERMRRSTVPFHLRAMGSRAWSRFWATQPARHEKEPAADYTERIFPFYAELVSRCCADPTMSVEQVTELADLLHTAAWNRLVTTCMSLNVDEVDVPNSVAASVPTPTSGQM